MLVELLTHYMSLKSIGPPCFVVLFQNGLGAFEKRSYIDRSLAGKPWPKNKSANAVAYPILYIPHLSLFLFESLPQVDRFVPVRFSNNNYSQVSVSMS